MNVKQITIEGAPFERGLAYGAGCREEIRMCISRYADLFLDRKGVSWEQAAAMGEAYIPAIRKYDNNYIEEMRGIAEGAGVRLADILALNVRSEIMFTGRKPPAEPDECTAFSAVWPATEGGKALAGQTWDFARCLRDAMVVLRVKSWGGAPELLMFTEAGFIGGKGMNASGVSLTLNALRVEEPCAGVPLHVRMRGVLDSTSVSAAYARAVSGEIACPANLIITQGDGVSLSLEMDGRDVDVLLPEGGVIVHTNHFVGPRMILRHGHAATGSTYVRLQRAEALLHGKTGITPEYLMDVLRDHVGQPTSICVHADPSLPEISQGATNYGLVMDLTERCAYFAAGNPCEGEYIRFTF